ncbi:hypothetical protein J2Y03_004473 [Neobacillus niacini]|nr:hypothetical protein [Neobacillus niacini]
MIGKSGTTTTDKMIAKSKTMIINNAGILAVYLDVDVGNLRRDLESSHKITKSRRSPGFFGCLASPSILIGR